MKSVELSNGKTAIVREWSDLKRGDVRRLYKTFDDAGLVPGKQTGYEGSASLVDAALLMLVESWDLDVPVSMDALADLSLSDYKALDEATDDAVKKMLGMDETDPKSGSLSSPSDSTESSQPAA